jgi:ferrous iron transport protein B
MTTIKTPPPPVRHLVVALVGNPNTGKTTLFNALAGMRQRVGNYPGVTVETKKGSMAVGPRTFDLVDLPGTYSLAPRSPDEMLAVDLILGQQKGEPRPDVVVSIVDAANLERNLYLTTQVLELGVPVVVALNMIDVAEAHGLRLDAACLEQQLGVRAVPIQANKGKGLDRLKQAIAEAAVAGLPPRKAPSFPEAFEHEVGALRDHLVTLPPCHLATLPPFLVRRLLLDVGGYTERRFSERYDHDLGDHLCDARQRLAAAGCAVPAVEARARYGWIRQATAGCVRRPEKRPITWTDHFDRVLTHKIAGMVVFLSLMFLVFTSIFYLAQWPMDWIKAGQDWLADTLRDALPPGPLTSLLIDGVVRGVGAVVVFLPQIIILFGFIAVLEDCGYMARAAFLMDKLMAWCGLSGKSFIPMLSSVACAVPGIMATRVIENRRDRLATILVAPLMSCSARLPVYTLLISAFLPAAVYGWWVPSVTMFAMYLIGIVVAPLVAFALKRTLLRGETPVFVMEMPLYKWPSARLVARRMWDSGRAFLWRAGTLIFASMVVVWALLYFPYTDGEGRSYEERIEEAKDSAEEANRLLGEWKEHSALGRMGKAIEPAVKPLGWDWRIGMAALASFPAREVVVGTLGIIYHTGKVESDDLRDGEGEGAAKAGQLREALARATWDNDPEHRKVFSVPVALSLMVFFALCCQCASTLAVIRRETNSWRWPLFTFTYMTVLAYAGALVVYQVGRWFT